MPQAKRVSTRALTKAGWVAGDLHIPGAVRVADYLNRKHDFLTLTDVFTEGQDDSMPYLALQWHAVFLIVCPYDKEPLAAEEFGTLEHHKISCLTAVGSVSGLMATRPGVRLSDRLAHHRMFLTVTDCSYRVRDPFSHEVFEETHPFVFLNTDKIIGIAEEEPPE